MKSAQDYLSERASGYARGGFNSRLHGETRGETLYLINAGPIWADTYAGWESADRMIKEGLVFSYTKVCGKDVPFKCYADGDSFCCVGEGFTNLQESSNYAFGDSFEEALANFKVEVAA